MKLRLRHVTLALAALAGVAQATTMIALDLRGLTERAERVVLATVEKTESHWTDDHAGIYSEVTLRIGRSYKGDGKPGESFVVRREGGTVDGIGMHVFGSPVFAVGEEVVVFSETRGSRSRWVVGMAQGKLRVTTDLAGRKMVTTPDLREVKLVGPQRAARALTIDDFEKEIREYVKVTR